MTGAAELFKGLQIDPDLRLPAMTQKQMPNAPNAKKRSDLL